jgi:hemolysin D
VSETTPPSNKRHQEQAFLPAALEVRDTPPSPIGRAIVWTIMLFFLLAVLWAGFGKVDIVAVAQGKIIPSGHSKLIQPLETGVVRSLYVKEG